MQSLFDDLAITIAASALFKNLTADHALLIVDFLLASAVAVVFLGLIRVVRRFFGQLDARLRGQDWNRFKSVYLQNQRLVSRRELMGFVSRAIQFFSWLVVLGLALVGLAIVLELFPRTRPLANAALGALGDAIATVVFGIVDYLPNLLVILLAIGVANFVVRLMRAVFLGIKLGRIHLPNFYADWADTTFNLLRVVLYLVLFIVIFPYLPGSDSVAFQGLSIFVGLIVSLGSTTAVANIVAGVVLTYTRAFRVGDFIAIGDTKGSVSSRGAFVTQINTYKNELVSIPNASILSSHIVNYNDDSLGVPLTLHTEVTIGYSVPWRQVEALLLEAAANTDNVLETPAPYVLQRKLNDFYVHYELNVATRAASQMPKVYSDLHRAIQDAFDAAGVEILSPHVRELRGLGVSQPAVRSGDQAS